jgi:hypothetical protein
LVLEKALAGPLNLLVKFSTLQEYGVDKPFFLENDNVDASQRNVVFLVRGEKARTVVRVAGMWNSCHFPLLLVYDVLKVAMRLMGLRLTLHRSDQTDTQGERDRTRVLHLLGPEAHAGLRSAA